MRRCVCVFFLCNRRMLCLERVFFFSAALFVLLFPNHSFCAIAETETETCPGQQTEFGNRTERGPTSSRLSACVAEGGNEPTDGSLLSRSRQSLDHAARRLLTSAPDLSTLCANRLCCRDDCAGGAVAARAFLVLLGEHRASHRAQGAVHARAPLRGRGCVSLCVITRT